jgi:hypothetical protein
MVSGLGGSRGIYSWLRLKNSRSTIPIVLLFPYGPITNNDFGHIRSSIFVAYSKQKKRRKLMTAIIQTLRTEHEEILKMLTVAEALAHRLDKEERVPQKTLEKVVEFFGVFVGKCHDGKENGILFPALISMERHRKDSLVGSLLR